MRRAIAYHGKTETVVEIFDNDTLQVTQFVISKKAWPVVKEAIKKSNRNRAAMLPKTSDDPFEATFNYRRGHERKAPYSRHS